MEICGRSLGSTTASKEPTADDRKLRAGPSMTRGHTRTTARAKATSRGGGGGMKRASSVLRVAAQRSGPQVLNNTKNKNRNEEKKKMMMTNKKRKKKGKERKEKERHDQLEPRQFAETMRLGKPGRREPSPAVAEARGNARDLAQAMRTVRDRLRGAVSPSAILELEQAWEEGEGTDADDGEGDGDDEDARPSRWQQLFGGSAHRSSQEGGGSRAAAEPVIALAGSNLAVVSREADRSTDNNNDGSGSSSSSSGGGVQESGDIISSWMASVRADSEAAVRRATQAIAEAGRNPGMMTMTTAIGPPLSPAPSVPLSRPADTPTPTHSRRRRRDTSSTSTSTSGSGSGSSSGSTITGLASSAVIGSMGARTARQVAMAVGTTFGAGK